jgi:hypothetical protein
VSDPSLPKTQGDLVERFLAGSEDGVKGALSIAGAELLSFGWYPVARKVGGAIWVRRQMYSEATARQIKTVRRVLIAHGYVEGPKVDEPNRDKWWAYASAAPDDGSKASGGEA